jgi:hypothetical protein
MTASLGFRAEKSSNASLRSLKASCWVLNAIARWMSRAPKFH